MAFDTFEYDGSDPTMPDDMEGWFEIFEEDELGAWIASDTTTEVRR